MRSFFLRFIRWKSTAFIVRQRCSAISLLVFPSMIRAAISRATASLADGHNLSLFDAAGKLVRDKIWFSKTYNLDYGEAEYASLMKNNNVTSACQGTVSAGNYTLKVVVRQAMASKTSALAKLITAAE